MTCYNAGMKNPRINALCIIKNDDKILVSRGYDEVENKNFARLLGGGVEFGEKALEALQREFKEELGATLKNEKLLSVIENIFEFNGEAGHEITFLYSAEIVEKEFFESDKFKILDSEKEKYAEWVNIEEIKNGLIVYPKETISYL